MVINKGSIEKHSFKISIGVAIVVCLFLITIAINFTDWKGKMENRCQENEDKIEHIGEKIIGMRAQLTALETENTDLKVRLAMIETKLTNIELHLVDIKEALKND